MKTCRCLRKVKAPQQFLCLELIFIGKNKVKDAELKNCNTSSHTFKHVLYYKIFCCELVIISVVVKFGLLVCVSLKVCSPV